MSDDAICAREGCGQPLGEGRRDRKYCCGNCRNRSARDAYLRRKDAERWLAENSAPGREGGSDER